MAREDLLDVEAEIKNDVGLVTLSGQLMAESRTKLERLLRDWTEDGLRFVRIHCGKLEYIDSAGLSTMIGASHRLKRAGGSLVLCEMNPTVGALFEVASMEHYFELFETAEDADKALKKLAAARKRKGKAALAAETLKPRGKPKPRTKVAAPAKSKN